MGFTLHPAEKHPSNPVVRADRPWEGWRLEIYGNVIYDNGFHGLLMTEDNGNGDPLQPGIVNDISGNVLNFILTDTDTLPLRVQLRNRGGHDVPSPTVLTGHWNLQRNTQISHQPRFTQPADLRDFQVDRIHSEITLRTEKRI